MNEYRATPRKEELDMLSHGYYGVEGQQALQSAQNEKMREYAAQQQEQCHTPPGSPKIPPVSEALGRMERQLSELSDHLDVLAEMLEPVLGVNNTVDRESGEFITAQTSPFAAQINDQTTRVRQMVSRVRALLQRLEV